MASSLLIVLNIISPGWGRSLPGKPMEYFGCLRKYHKLHLRVVRLRLASDLRETRARLCCRSLHLQQQRRSRSVNLWEFCFAACRVRSLPLLRRPPSSLPPSTQKCSKSSGEFLPEMQSASSLHARLPSQNSVHNLAHGCAFRGNGSNLFSLTRKRDQKLL